MTDPSALLHALSDPTRRGLFEHLMKSGETPVTALTARAGVSQPAVSKHLAILKSAGLVTCRASGRQNFYVAAPKALSPLADWIEAHQAFWEDRLNRLADTLDRMDQ